MESIKIGLIAGRHKMPVKRYLINRRVNAGHDAYVEAFNSAKKAAELLNKCICIDLYYTGLTEALIGAMDAFELEGVRYRLMRYDSDTKKYEPIKRINRFNI